MEAWKEAEKNCHAKQLGNKFLLHGDIVKNGAKNCLKAVKSLDETKLEALKELRLKTNAPIPDWMEEERRERVMVHNNHHSVVCAIPPKPTKQLKPTASALETKKSVLSDIRRNQPVEAWKEAERNEKMALFEQKRALSHDIESKRVRNLSASREQVQLKD